MAKHRQIHKIEPSIVWPLVLLLLIFPVIFPIFEASFLRPMPLISTSLTPLLHYCYSCRYLLRRRRFRFSSSSSLCHFYLCPDPEALSSSCYIWSRKRYRVTLSRTKQNQWDHSKEKTKTRKGIVISGDLSVSLYLGTRRTSSPKRSPRRMTVAATLYVLRTRRTANLRTTLRLWSLQHKKRKIVKIRSTETETETERGERKRNEG